MATLRPCLLSLRDLCDANDADDAVCEISHQQNADIVLISQCLQCADFLVIAGIHTVVLVVGTNLLQGINDDQSGIQVLIEETCELFFQPLPDAAAFRLHDQPFGGFFTAHKLEKALLQAVEGVLQR